MNNVRVYPLPARASVTASRPTIRIIADAREAVADGSATGRLAVAMTDIADLIESGPPSRPADGQPGPVEKVEELAGAAEEQHRADPRWKKKRAGSVAAALLVVAVDWAAPAGFVADRVEFVIQQLQQQDDSSGITIQNSPGATVNIDCTPDKEDDHQEPPGR